MGTLLVQIQSKLSAFTGLGQGSQTTLCLPLIVHKLFKNGSWPAEQELPPQFVLLLSIVVSSTITIKDGSCNRELQRPKIAKLLEFSCANRHRPYVSYALHTHTPKLHQQESAVALKIHINALLT